MEFRKYYDEYNPVVTFIDKDSNTMQEFKQECDINRILKRYNDTGVLPHIRNSGYEYGDVGDIHSLFDVFVKLELAQKTFEQIPSEIRQQFGNDPMRFESWIYENPEVASRFGYLNSPLAHKNDDDLTTTKTKNEEGI